MKHLPPYHCSKSHPQHHWPEVVLREEKVSLQNPQFLPVSLNLERSELMKTVGNPRKNEGKDLSISSETENSKNSLSVPFTMDSYNIRGIISSLKIQHIKYKIYPQV